jgi:hypothetical protein
MAAHWQSSLHQRRRLDSGFRGQQWAATHPSLPLSRRQPTISPAKGTPQTRGRQVRRPAGARRRKSRVHLPSFGHTNALRLHCNPLRKVHSRRARKEGSERQGSPPCRLAELRDARKWRGFPEFKPCTKCLPDSHTPQYSFSDSQHPRTASPEMVKPPHVLRASAPVLAQAPSPLVHNAGRPPDCHCLRP